MDNLLRTTKRFIGKSKVIGPEHISIQRLSLIRLSDDSGTRSAAAKSNRKVPIFSFRHFLLPFFSCLIYRNIFVLFVFTIPNPPSWRLMWPTTFTFTIFKTVFALVVRSFISTISVFMKFVGQVKTRMWKFILIIIKNPSIHSSLGCWWVLVIGNSFSTTIWNETFLLKYSTCRVCTSLFHSSTLPLIHGCVLMHRI